VKPLHNGMLSPVLVRRPKDLWPDGLHVVTEWGATCPDDDVWAQARRLGLVITTKGHDYEPFTPASLTLRRARRGNRATGESRDGAVSAAIGPFGSRSIPELSNRTNPRVRG
jgi:hypothetical protein